MPNQDMQERWAQMQKNMEQMQKSTDPERQQQLMQQNMQHMQHMQQMMNMMHGPMGGPGMMMGPGMMHHRMMYPGMMYPGMMGWQGGPMMGHGGWHWMAAMEQRMRRVEQMLAQMAEKNKAEKEGNK